MEDPENPSTKLWKNSKRSKRQPQDIIPDAVYEMLGLSIPGKSTSPEMGRWARQRKLISSKSKLPTSPEGQTSMPMKDELSFSTADQPSSSNGLKCSEDTPGPRLRERRQKALYDELDDSYNKRRRSPESSRRPTIRRLSEIDLGEPLTNSRRKIAPSAPFRRLSEVNLDTLTKSRKKVTPPSPKVIKPKPPPKPATKRVSVEPLTGISLEIEVPDWKLLKLPTQPLVDEDEEMFIDEPVPLALHGFDFTKTLSRPSPIWDIPPGSHYDPRPRKRKISGNIITTAEGSLLAPQAKIAGMLESSSAEVQLRKTLTDLLKRIQEAKRRGGEPLIQCRHRSSSESPWRSGASSSTIPPIVKLKIDKHLQEIEDDDMDEVDRKRALTHEGKLLPVDVPKLDKNESKATKFLKDKSIEKVESETHKLQRGESNESASTTATLGISTQSSLEVDGYDNRKQKPVLNGAVSKMDIFHVCEYLPLEDVKYVLQTLQAPDPVIPRHRAKDPVPLDKKKLIVTLGKALSMSCAYNMAVMFEVEEIPLTADSQHKRLPAVLETFTNFDLPSKTPVADNNIDVSIDSFIPHKERNNDQHQTTTRLRLSLTTEQVRQLRAKPSYQVWVARYGTRAVTRRLAAASPTILTPQRTSVRWRAAHNRILAKTYRLDDVTDDDEDELAFIRRPLVELLASDEKRHNPKKEQVQHHASQSLLISRKISEGLEMKTKAEPQGEGSTAADTAAYNKRAGRPKVNRIGCHCLLCGTLNTPQWRFMTVFDDPWMDLVCNACYMKFNGCRPYYCRNGRPPPPIPEMSNIERPTRPTFAEYKVKGPCAFPHLMRRIESKQFSIIKKDNSGVLEHDLMHDDEGDSEKATKEQVGQQHSSGGSLVAQTSRAEAVQGTDNKTPSPQMSATQIVTDTKSEKQQEMDIRDSPRNGSKRSSLEIQARGLGVPNKRRRSSSEAPTKKCIQAGDEDKTDWPSIANKQKTIGTSFAKILYAAHHAISQSSPVVGPPSPLTTTGYSSSSNNATSSQRQDIAAAANDKQTVGGMMTRRRTGSISLSTPVHDFTIGEIIDTIDYVPQIPPPLLVDEQLEGIETRTKRQCLGRNRQAAHNTTLLKSGENTDQRATKQNLSSHNPSSEASIAASDFFCNNTTPAKHLLPAAVQVGAPVT